MRLLKKIIKIFAIILLIVAAVGFIFFPSKIHVERSIMISQPKEKVYDYVADMHNYNKWSPWFRKDPAAQYVFEGPRQGVGAKLSWNSNVKEVGAGSMLVTQAESGKLIREDLVFAGHGGSKSGFDFSGEGNTTKIVWSMDMEAGANPLMRIMGSMMDKWVGPDFESGLNTLKQNLESIPDVSEIKIEETTVESMPYLFVHDEAGMSSVSNSLMKDYSSIGASMQKQKLNMAGAPFAIYYNDNRDKLIFDAAIMVNKKGVKDGNVMTGEIKSGKVLMAKYFGDYLYTSKAHEAIRAYAKANNKTFTGAPWEIYVTDPGIVKDTAKWETDVYYSIQ